MWMHSLAVWVAEEIKRAFVRKECCTLSSGRVGQLFLRLPFTNTVPEQPAKSRSSYRGNCDQLWRSCLHLTLRRHYISSFNTVSGSGHSSLDAACSSAAYMLSARSSTIRHRWTSWNRGQHCLALCDSCPLTTQLSTESHMESPRRFGECHIWEGDTTPTRLLQATVHGPRCTGRDAYFCQLVISDQPNYTLINQV